MNDLDFSVTPLKNECGTRAAGWLCTETLAFGSSQLDQVPLECLPSLRTWGVLLGEGNHTVICKKREVGIMQEALMSAMRTKITTQNLPNLHNDDNQKPSGWTTML